MVKTFLVDNCSYQGCNNHCVYCRGNNVIEDDGRIFRKTLQKLREGVDASILKISGYGEITMIPDWKERIAEQEESYDSIQIITNGRNLTRRDLDFLSSGDYTLCISLDGISQKTNAARRNSKEELEKILTNLNLASFLGSSLEINTVLTSFNISSFPEFLKFIRDINAVCYPFPVRRNRRHSSQKSLSPSNKETRKALQNVLEDYEDFKTALPPKPYLERLTDFMLDGKRRRCYVPEVVLGIDPQGDILRCPCSGTEKVGNLFGRDQFQATKERGKVSGFQEECRDCFTHYEVINLFIEGKINEEEMRSLPLYSKSRLNMLKQK